MAHIVVVDDDQAVREIVSDCLGNAGYQVTTLESGQKLSAIIKEQAVDLVVLDLGLPDRDGLSLMREIKAQSNVGVIILSGRGETTERIIGLEVGADDYLGKPFEPRELLARIRSVLRRVEKMQEIGSDSGDVFTFERWALDRKKLELLAPDGTPIAFTSSEFSLLQAFVEHPNRVLSRDQLMEFAYDIDKPAFDRSIDVKITRLRKKIEADPKNPKFIKTIRNHGYMFAAKVIRR